jgi:transketolase
VPAGLREKLLSFVTVQSVDGHDPDKIIYALSTRAQIVCLNTTKGKGVSFLENRMDSHYQYLNKETYEKALAEQ